MQTHLTPSATDMTSLFTRQLIMLSGKGGTGKTTLAVMLAQVAAAQGKNVLLCHVNRLTIPAKEKEYLARHPNLTQISIQPQPAFKEYVLLKLKSEKIYSLLFESSSAFDVLRKAAPALNELLIVGKIYWECKQKTFWFTPKWDHVIVDLPSTGHAMTILNIPQVILEIFPKGIVANETHRIQQLLDDSKRTSLVLVSQPEYMIVQETIEFAKQMNQRFAAMKPMVMLNKFPSLPLSPEADQQLLKTSLPPEAMAMVTFFRQRYQLAASFQKQLLQEFPHHVLTLPMIVGGAVNPEFYPRMETELLQAFKPWVNLFKSS